jgi:hypothetical protein
MKNECSSNCVSWCAVQIMSVGGNGRARQFFKQHGWTELGADKIEQKVRWLHPISVLPCAMHWVQQTCISSQRPDILA